MLNVEEQNSTISRSWTGGSNSDPRNWLMGNYASHPWVNLTTHIPMAKYEGYFVDTVISY